MRNKWNVGTLGCWNNGLTTKISVQSKEGVNLLSPIFHYSNIPSFIDQT
jgi:hypothetical protein